MKKLIKSLSVTAALVLAAAALSACGSKTESKAESNPATSSQVSQVEDTTAQVEETTAEAEETTAHVEETTAEAEETTAEAAEPDYENPDVVLSDFNSLKTYAKEMQSNEHQGEVVKVMGFNKRSVFEAKASVMIKGDDGTSFGTTYRIIGIDSIEGYPEDDDIIEITGVVTLEERGIGCYIAVPKSQVTIAV